MTVATNGTCKDSVVHALALTAQRFKEKESKGQQRFHVIGSRRSSQKLGIDTTTFASFLYAVDRFNSWLDV